METPQWVGHESTEGDLTRPVHLETEAGDVMTPRAITYRFSGTEEWPDLEAHVVIGDRGAEVRELHIVAKDGARAIRDADLAQIVCARLAADAVLAQAWSVTRTEDGRWQSVAPLRESPVGSDMAFRALSQRLRQGGGRPAPNPYELQAVASVYLDNIDSAPVEAVARHINRDRRTAQRWIRRAADRGLLPQGTRGHRRRPTTNKDDDA